MVIFLIFFKIGLFGLDVIFWIFFYKFIPAFFAAKIQILSVDSQMHTVFFREIYFTERIFDHDVIDLAGSFVKYRFFRWSALKHPGFENPVAKVYNAQ